MLETDMTALLRAVLDEVCADIPPSDTAARQRVASRILEAARSGHWLVEDLKQAGRAALTSVPTMWR